MLDMTLEKGNEIAPFAASCRVDSANHVEARNLPRGLEKARACDSKGIAMWVDAVAKNLLPHSAMICTHSVQHSFGYEVEQVISNGIPQSYLDAITTPRNNVRSKIFSRLMASERAVYLEVDSLSMEEQDVLPELKLVSYTNLVGYSYRTNGEFGRATNVAFFEVGQENSKNYDELRQALMPSLHAILSGPSNTTSEALDTRSSKQRSLIARERKVAELVVQGKANKEIARILNMNERTVKQYVCNLMLKLDVMNRTALAVNLYKILEFNHVSHRDVMRADGDGNFKK